MTSTATIDQLRRHLSKGARVFTPRSPGYNAQRKVVNKRFDKKPAVLVQTVTDADVAATIRFARDANLQLSIRSGGCSPTGFSSNDGGVMLDLRKMSSVSVDHAAQTARVGPGLLLEHAYTEFGKTGLMLVAGECKPVGLSGITLGGGFSLLSRSLGLGCDNLLGATMVTAGGEVVTASESSAPDLFWALRGAGGGNFGVVTSLELKLHKLEPKLYCATAMWPLSQAVSVLTEGLAFFHDEAPKELDAVWAMAYRPTKAKPKGEPILIMVGVYNGPPAKGEKLMKRLTSLGTPIDASGAAQSYVDFLAKDFPMPPDDFHDYFQSGFLSGPIPKAAVELLVDRFQNAPHGTQDKNVLDNIIVFELAGGAINEVAPDATAFVHRRHSALLSLNATWQGKTGVDDPPEKKWADTLHSEMAPYWSGFVYQNYPDIRLKDWAHAYYGQNLPRLTTIKRRYDPDNFFRFAQSIPVR